MTTYASEHHIYKHFQLLTCNIAFRSEIHANKWDPIWCLREKSQLAIVIFDWLRARRAEYHLMCFDLQRQIVSLTTHNLPRRPDARYALSITLRAEQMLRHIQHICFAEAVHVWVCIQSRRCSETRCLDWPKLTCLQLKCTATVCWVSYLKLLNLVESVG